MLTDAHLVRAESRRGATWYELAHDRLIEPVKEDNARWREVNLSHFERLATWWDEQNRPDQALLTGPDLVNAETGSLRTPPPFPPASRSSSRPPARRPTRPNANGGQRNGPGAGWS